MVFSLIIPTKTTKAKKEIEDCDEERVKEIAEYTDKKLPINISKISVWYKTRASNCNLEHYYEYKLQKGEITRDMIFEAKYNDMRRRACKTSSVRNLLSRGVTVGYKFFGSQGRGIATFDIKESDCKK